MLTIELGKYFCDWYNKEHNTNFTPSEIFKNIIAPILFDGKKNLIRWNNSKFVYWNKELSDFKDVLDSFCEMVESDTGGLMDSLKVFGGCACPYDSQKTKIYKPKPQTTMFCYCENLYFDIDERYCSWIGSAFLMTFPVSSSNFSIVINNEEYVKTMFSSINAYKKALTENPDIKGEELGKWNLLYFYNYYNNKEKINTIIERYYDGNVLKIPFSFEHIIFTLAKYFPDVKYLNIEKYDKTNTTCGTIFVNNMYVNKMYDILERIYKDVENNDDFDKFNFSSTFGGRNILYKVIESGAIYDGIFDPLKDVKLEELTKKKKLLFKYIETIMTDEDKNLAKSFIETIQRNKKNRGKSRKIIKFEISNYKSIFIDNITNFVEEVGCNDDVFNKMVDYVITATDSEFRLMSSYLKYLYN